MDMIVETSDNRLFRVRDAGHGLDRVWLGVPVKRRGNTFVEKAKKTERLVRKAFSRIVAEVA